MVDSNRLGGSLTADTLLQILALLGTPTVFPDGPPDAGDVPGLLGQVAASLEAAILQQVPGDRVDDFVSRYAEQLGDDPDNALRVQQFRISLTAVQLQELAHATGRPAVTTAAAAVVTAGDLLAYQVLAGPDSSGRPAPKADLLEVLKMAKSNLARTRRSMEDTLAAARRAGLGV
ncbi:MAG: hypothetical protein HOV87_11865 [Catenulispora sp.]|nr:hypothetical protein [Catenulispora sp.]NUT43925.1 hypothetical protein [Thermoactinospora sp.]